MPSSPSGSIIGFGVTRLLGFDLLPRIKAINRVRLYRRGLAMPETLSLSGNAGT